MRVCVCVFLVCVCARVVFVRARADMYADTGWMEIQLQLQAWV